MWGGQMNRNFTRYQKLPSLDALLVSVNLTEAGDRTESRENAPRSRRGNEADVLNQPCVPPPYVGGYGAQPTTKPTLAKQANPLRA